MSESFNLMVLTINNYLTILKITEKDGTLGSHKSLQNLMKDFRKVSKFMKTQNEVDILFPICVKIQNIVRHYPDVYQLKADWIEFSEIFVENVQVIALEQRRQDDIASVQQLTKEFQKSS